MAKKETEVKKKKTAKKKKSKPLSGKDLAAAAAQTQGGPSPEMFAKADAYDALKARIDKVKKLRGILDKIRKEAAVINAKKAEAQKFHDQARDELWETEVEVTDDLPLFDKDFYEEALEHGDKP